MFLGAITTIIFSDAFASRIPVHIIWTWIEDLQPEKKARLSLRTRASSPMHRNLSECSLSIVLLKKCKQINLCLHLQSESRLSPSSAMNICNFINFLNLNLQTGSVARWFTDQYRISYLRISPSIKQCKWCHVAHCLHNGFATQSFMLMTLGPWSCWFGLRSHICLHLPQEGVLLRMHLRRHLLRGFPPPLTGNDSIAFLFPSGSNAWLSIPFHWHGNYDKVHKFHSILKSSSTANRKSYTSHTAASWNWQLVANQM